MDEHAIKKIIEYYKTDEELRFELESFINSVSEFFRKNPTLNRKEFPIIHSVKSRIKSDSHLEDKLNRMMKKGREVTQDNLFVEVNDLLGVRVLHLYQDQFNIIHEQIMKKVNISEDWLFVEEPKAYTWDPEYKKYYESLSIKTAIKESYYTSVHYVIKINNNNPITCEIQVRTLFEEIWGEIDHTINYPHETESIACREQLRVLSKLVSTGSRLADSIFRSYNDHMDKY